MSRVINTNSPLKIRNQNRRTIAELLRRLGQKPAIDEDACDMAAAIVFALREIDEGVEKTVSAWEKRDYWLKAERFLREWEWVTAAAADIEDVLRHEAWDLLPELLVSLSPRFADIEIKTMTRKPALWQGAYSRLVAGPPGKSPW